MVFIIHILILFKFRWVQDTKGQTVVSPIYIFFIDHNCPNLQLWTGKVIKLFHKML